MLARVSPFFLFFAVALTNPALSCQRYSPVQPEEMVRDATWIVRARAVDYFRSPADPNVMTSGEPDSRIRFEVVEVLRGANVGRELVLPGYLSEVDDYNGGPVPYAHSRYRGGSCFANTYRNGAIFLLFLQKHRSRDEYTVNWYAMGPVNEQLRSDSDPWLTWVRTATTSPAQAAADPPPCAQPVLSHLDFLTGTFDVHARTRLSGSPDDWEESVGTSTFERRVLDCAVLERYEGTRRTKPFEALRLFTGRPDGKSLRLAVSDSEHGPLYVYEGEPADSGLTFLLPLTIPSGHVLLRIRYDAITRDGFVTESARSTDLGKTWDTTGRAEYRRAKNTGKP